MLRMIRSVGHSTQPGEVDSPRPSTLVQVHPQPAGMFGQRRPVVGGQFGQLPPQAHQVLVPTRPPRFPLEPNLRVAQGGRRDQCFPCCARLLPQQFGDVHRVRLVFRRDQCLHNAQLRRGIKRRNGPFRGGLGPRVLLGRPTLVGFGIAPVRPCR